jgi:hypothetical protein
MHAILRPLAVSILSCFVVCSAGLVARSEELQPGVRGLATRAPAEMKIDGDLSEFRGAFCTPVNYFHPQTGERAAQFFYMWDETAFYAGLRTLDTKQANFAPDDRLWEGDGVEWYFDTRRDENFRGLDWGKGAVHCYWRVQQDRGEPAVCAPGYLDAIGRSACRWGRKTDMGRWIQAALGEFSQFQGGSGRGHRARCGAVL